MTNQSLFSMVKEETSKATGLSLDQLSRFPYENESVLINPFKYSDMDKAVAILHAYKKKADGDPNMLLAVDTDYDTDGVMAAAVMSAALNVLGFRYAVYPPDMADGYGLSPVAVDKMKKLFEKDGKHISLILTADNGTNAIEGVDYAKSLGIPVLVTDHHLTTSENAKALAIVNPNKRIKGGEPYPFKGNAGGAVIWKVFLAYCQKYAPDKYDLIFDLIVFAGIANVGDVMPIVSENHYMVRKAVEEINRLWRIYDAVNCGFEDDPYPLIKRAPYPNYNAVFYGLYDLLCALQKSKDQKRKDAGKKPIALPRDESLISWYLAPAFNSVRRVYSSSALSMQALLSVDPKARNLAINKMLEANRLKTEYRDKVLEAIKEGNHRQHKNTIKMPNPGDPAVVLVNVKGGIAGLVAGQLTGVSHAPSVVFSLDSDLPETIYSDKTIEQIVKTHPKMTITASARSAAGQPLNVILGIMAKEHPSLQIGGGGHAMAAGYKIYLDQFQDFVRIFKKTANRVKKMDALEMTQAMLVDGPADDANVVAVDPLELMKEIEQQANTQANRNEICLTVGHLDLDPGIPVFDVRSSNYFVKDLWNVIHFEDTLRPFGHDFFGETKFYLAFNLQDLNKMNFNRGFWQTFKFDLQGVEVLTWNVDLADELKQDLDKGLNPVVVLPAKLNVNEFRNRQTLQLIVDEPK